MKLPNDMIKELDSVGLTTDLPEHGLSAATLAPSCSFMKAAKAARWNL
jgi:hypothetical protein